MADIFELAQARGAPEAPNGKGESLTSDLEADIIIFPGVRYDRDDDATRNRPRKKSARGKTPLPSKEPA